MNTPSDDDNSPDYVDADGAIKVGKKPIVCDPMSKTNTSGQLLSVMPNKKNKVLRDNIHLMS